MRGVDLFAGAGGFTLGAKRAGVDVVFAANHWSTAVRVHEHNNPTIVHAQQDLRQFDFSTLPDFDVLLASPSCQGHSRTGRVGRTKSPRVRSTHDDYRSTAWAVIDCLEVCRPPFAFIENVPEYFDWALFDVWREALRRLGYSTTQQVLTTSRWGVPQRRKRAIVVAVHEGEAPLLQDSDDPEPGLHDVFDSRAEGWVRIADIPKTRCKPGYFTAQQRAAVADERLAGALGWGMHVNYPSHWGRPLDEPVVTITTKALSQLWWVRDGRYRKWTVDETARAMTFPDAYLPDDVTKGDAGILLGNAIPPTFAERVIQETLRYAA